MYRNLRDCLYSTIFEVYIAHEINKNCNLRHPVSMTMYVWALFHHRNLTCNIRCNRCLGIDFLYNKYNISLATWQDTEGKIAGCVKLYTVRRFVQYTVCFAASFREKLINDCCFPQAVLSTVTSCSIIQERLERCVLVLRWGAERECYLPICPMHVPALKSRSAGWELI